MLLFRFVAALTLIVAVSLVGIALEKRELALKRAVSLQHYRLHELAAARPLQAADPSSRLAAFR